MSGQGQVRTLPTTELKKRIDAARTLHGWRQIDLQARLYDHGLGKTEAGRLERGDLPLTQARLDALCRVLRVPERWFVAESVDEVTGYRDPGQPAITDEQIREAAALLGPQLLAAARAVRPEQGQEQQETAEPGHPAGATADSDGEGRRSR